ncbi:alpha/beta hydrolase [Paucibacter sp. O1-1]|nr:alpha/beta hydrolase [Paucibacter sp. O1-1]MDA3830097.1 alpha/beta hydrolase [Paucibacter sp. O1-1]
MNVAYTAWGPADAPVLLCCGGVANVAMRFSYLASDLSDRWRVVCMDWLGRGRSGWLAAEGDYSLATYAEQIRQMIAHLGDRPVTVLGSSMGGSATIAMMAKHPGLVERLILNDVGPHIPARRRRRRADTIARHYVFRQPSDLLRKVGASQKNDGPVSEDIRFNPPSTRPSGATWRTAASTATTCAPCRPTAAMPSAACCSGASGSMWIAR